MRKSDAALKGYITSFAKMLGNRGLANHGYHYNSIYDFASREFGYYKPSFLTADEKSVVMMAIRNLGFKPQVKQCFYNSQMLAISDMTDKIRYVEGYAINIIPTLHGWCEINGKVIDLTWKDDGEYVLGNFPKDRSYAGVPFPTEYFAGLMTRNKYCTTLLEDYENDFPVMKNEWKGGEGVTLSSVKS
jgi:hypothetical protein